MAIRKTHIRSVRLKNNAGINFPICKANAKLLDMSATGWATVPPHEATCKNCKRIYEWSLKPAPKTEHPWGHPGELKTPIIKCVCPHNDSD